MSPAGETFFLSALRCPTYMRGHGWSVRFLVFAAVAVGLSALAGCTSSPPDAQSCRPWAELERPAPTSAPPANARKVRAPGPGAVYAGFYSIGDVEQGLAAFVDKSGERTPPVVFTFHDWGGEAEAGGFDVDGRTLRTLDTPLEGETITPAELAKTLANDGAVLALAWDCLGYYALEPGYFLGLDTRTITQAAILDGTYDAYIEHVAAQVKALDVPVMLSPFGEFGLASDFGYGASGAETAESTTSVCDAYGDPAWPDGPERTRDIYRHIVDVFRAVGADNVTWFLYTSTGYMNEAVGDFTWGHPGYVYPGDEYVDWIGQSLYFSDDEAMHNDDVGDLAYALDAGLSAWREVTERPFYAPEFGIAGDGTASLASSIEAALAALPASGVSAFTYADAPLFEAFFGLPRLGTHDDELDAWAEGLADDAYPAQVTVTAPADDDA